MLMGLAVTNTNCDRTTIASAMSYDRPWTVYIILASDGSLYTGITTDLERRFAEHKAGNAGKGAKYFHGGRRPEKIVYTEPSADRSSASRREAVIKSLSRQEKLALCGM